MEINLFGLSIKLAPAVVIEAIRLLARFLQRKRQKR